MQQVVQIFTDGGTRGNGKENSISGWGTYLVYGDYTKELFGGQVGATNNQMEIKAVIEGLKALSRYDIPIEIIMDSGYVRNCLKDKWYLKWQRNGWKTSKKEPVENREMWEELISLVKKLENVEFLQIQGHLNPNNNSKVDKAYDKFVKINQKFISRDEFLKYVEGNIKADLLANKGMDFVEVHDE